MIERAILQFGSGKAREYDVTIVHIIKIRGYTEAFNRYGQPVQFELGISDVGECYVRECPIEPGEGELRRQRKLHKQFPKTYPDPDKREPIIYSPIWRITDKSGWLAIEIHSSRKVNDNG